MYSAAVVIVVYAERPSFSEMMSFQQCLRIMSYENIIIIYSEGMDLSAYVDVIEQNNLNVAFLRWVSFDSSNFVSIESYNKLMVSYEFYKFFSDFDYILLYQLDAWVFSNELEKWTSKGYSYVGAPWLFRRGGMVGNGGFSLRKVTRFLQLTREKYSFRESFLHHLSVAQVASDYPVLYTVRHLFFKQNRYLCDIFLEDVFFSLVLLHYYKDEVPCWKEALSFSFELNPRKAYALNREQLPFGCHAYLRYDYNFWKKHIFLYNEYCDDKS